MPLPPGGAVQRPVGAGVPPRGLGLETAPLQPQVPLAALPRQGRVQALPLPGHRGHSCHRSQETL